MQVARLAAGDVVLVDVTRPVKFLAEGPWRNLALKLPRQELVVHLGFEPQGGLVRSSGTSAGRLLLELIQGANEERLSESRSALLQ
jgi:hypothetical protein